MLYFLDSNICIQYMRKGKVAEVIEARFLEYGPRNIKIPSIVMGELMHGAYKSKRAADTLKETKSFISRGYPVWFS